MFTHDGTLLTRDGAVFTHDGTVFTHDATLFTHDGTGFTHDGTGLTHKGTCSRMTAQCSSLTAHPITHDGTFITHDRPLFCPTCFAPPAPDPMNHPQLCLCSPMCEHKMGSCTHGPGGLGTLYARMHVASSKAPRAMYVRACSPKQGGC
jgi:hypothetical protein